MCRSICLVLTVIVAAGCLAAAPQEAPPKELIQYVRDARKAGLKDDQIEKNAITAGWAAPAVKDAIEATRNPAKTTSPEPAAAKSNTQTTPAFEMGQRNPNPEMKPAAPVVERGATPAASAPSASAPPASPVMTPETTNTAKPLVPASSSATNPGAGGPTKPAVVNRGVPDEYRIGEGDILQISVWGEHDASVPSGVVRPDGMISMPLIKDVHVAGLTPAEAELLITEQLSKQIKAADVTVIVSQIHSKKIFVVGGGVKKEGPIPFTYRMTVMQALSEAGGLSDYAKRKKIYVLRNENGREYKLAFDYDAVLKGEHMELNIPLLPGDTVVVPNH